MIPILYESDETAFVSNGIGRLRDAISVIVLEERNGRYECDMEYPITGAHFEDIKIGRIIAVTHGDSDDIQPFDIVSYSKQISGIVTFHAVHVSYRQSRMTVSGTNIEDLTSALQKLSDAEPDNPFAYSADFESDGHAGAFDGIPRTVRSMLGGVEGSILDTYGGEYEWNRFNVVLHRSRGVVRDFKIRYGVNMLDYQDEADYISTYTSVIPYYATDQTVVTGNRVTIAESGFDGRDNCVPLDLTSAFEEEVPTTEELEALAEKYLTVKQPHLPWRNIKVDFVRIQDYYGYESFADLLRCNLCDKVTVVFPEYDAEGTYKIVSTVYDVLRDRYELMELGSLSVSLASAIGYTPNSSSGSVVASSSGIPYIVGTQTATTASWTGVAPFASLETGQSICYKLTQTSASSATLNLTLSGGNTTGAIAVYGVSGNTRIGTHYAAGAVIFMTYDGTYWRVTPSYDTNNYDRIRMNGACKITGSAVAYYKMCAQLSDGSFAPLTTQSKTNTSTGTATPSTRSDFLLGGVVCFYATTTSVSAGSTTTNLYSAYPTCDMRYAWTTTTANYVRVASGNASAYQPLYLRVTPSGNTFRLYDTSTWANNLVTSLPTTENASAYIFLGQFVGNAYQLQLQAEHPVYRWDGTAFTPWGAKESITGVTSVNGETGVINIDLLRALVTDGTDTLTLIYTNENTV